MAISWFKKNIGARLTRGSFTWNVTVLAGGTALGQAISVLASLVLTRLYEPYDFGLLATYMAYVSIISVFSTGRYEMSITLPRSDTDAAGLVFVAIKICALISVLTLVLVPIVAKFANSEVIYWLYLLPLSVLAMGMNNIFQLWLNRRGKYQIMAIFRLLIPISTALVNILLGLIKVSGGLILGSIIGQAVPVIWVAWQIWLQDRLLFQGAGADVQKNMLRKYASLPAYIAPSHFIGTIALQIPVFIISHIYSLNEVGFFSLAYRVVTLPTLLVAGAIGDVYRERASKTYNDCGKFEGIFIKTLKTTTALALLLFVTLYFIVATLFPVLFGERWRIAGEYARILTISAFFQFIFTPVDKGALVVGATRYIFTWHSARMIMLLLLWFFAKYFGIPIRGVLWGLTAINVILYTIDGLVGIRFAKGQRGFGFR